MPHSIRASCCDQHFELAASCQREREVWLAAIHTALQQTPAWVGEPTPSFRLDDKGEVISSVDSDIDLVSGLPTILSIPELPQNNSDPDLSETFFPFLRPTPRTTKNKLRKNGSSRGEASPVTSRRGSSSSVKAIFGPMSNAESIVIRRSSPIARQQVDQALQDVISQSCLTARSYGYSRDSELFSSGSTTLSRTKSRLSKHESIRVPRSRTSDNLDLIMGRSSSARNANFVSTRPVKKLSVSSAPPVLAEGNRGHTRSHSMASTPISSLPASQSSSDTDSSEPHSIPTEVNLAPLPSAPATSATGSGLKPSRSLVRGVKDLFHRTGHHQPAPSVVPFPPSIPPSDENGDIERSAESNKPYNRWKMTSMRRRPRTAPESGVNHRSQLTNAFTNAAKTHPAFVAAV